MKRSHAWLIACCALVLASVCFSLLIGVGHDGSNLQSWAWQADSWRQSSLAFWTLWSAPLAGITPLHTFGNALSMTAVGVLGHAVGARPREALALLIAWPLSTLGLLFWPSIGWYTGLSGLLHGAVAIVVWCALTQRGARGIGTLLAAGLLTKLLLERGWAVPVAFDSNWGFNVVRAAHLSGAVIGLIAAAVTDGGTRIFSRLLQADA